MTSYDETLGLSGDELERLVRRLRSLSARAMSVRRDAVVGLLVELAEIGRLAEGGEAHPVPNLPDYALADAVVVIGGDALAALAAATASEQSDALAQRLVAELRVALDATH